jgi:hypothetical protein
MNRRLSILASVTLAVVALVALYGGSTVTIPSTAATEEDSIVTIRGLVQADGEDAIVEILVVARPDEDAGKRARGALHELYPDAIEADDDMAEGGSGGMQSEEFSANGLVWDALPVTVNYNSTGAPVGGALAALLAPLQTWTDEPTSEFAFVYGGTTSRCPSLYDGCPGDQVFDGYNDVGWDDIPSAGVLGVCWYGLVTDEMDIVIDSANFTWHTGDLPVPAGLFDLETVNLHELGHGVGLGHSDVPDGVMYPSVSAGQAKRVLHQDEIDGLSSLYPASSPTPTGTSTSTATATPTASPTPTATPADDTTPPSVSITYPSWGAFVSGDLTATVSASDDTAVQAVRFWLDGLYQGYDSTSPYSWSWDTTALSDGTHRILVEASDTSGNRSWDPVNFTVANGAPMTPSSVHSARPDDASAASGIHWLGYWVDGDYAGYDWTLPYGETRHTTALADGPRSLKIRPFDWTGILTVQAIIAANAKNCRPAVSTGGA